MRERENTKRQLNNKGFSLIELLVVIVIMGVLVTLATYSISVMRAGDTKRASKTIAGEISSMRNNTLAIAGDWQYEIVNDDGTYKLYTYRDGVEQECTNLGERVKIYYKNSESGTETQIGRNTKLIIKFVQGSGKVSGLYTADSVDLNTVTDIDLASSAMPSGGGYLTLKMTNATGGGEEDFKLYYETGTVIMD